MLAPLLASAQEAPTLRDVMTARGYGMGGAVRAIGGGTEAVDENPAAMGLYKRYLLELSGAWDPQNPFGFGSIGILDGGTSGPTAAGLSHQWVTLGTGGDQRTAHISTLAFAFPLGQALSLGFSGRNVLMSGAETANAVTGDVGLMLNLGGIVLSAAGHNLIDINHVDFQRYYSAGAGFVSQSFSLGADVRGDYNGASPRYSLNAGGELVLGNAIPLRLGYSHDAINRAERLGAGIGLLMDGSALDLGYSRQLGSFKSNLLALTLRMQMM
jgi:hypothetical protein